MSEFGAIIELIGTIVSWVIDRTLDILALSCLIAAHAFPWRWFEINVDFSRSWREYAVECLFLTLFDCVAVPLGLCSLASPLRWPALYHIIAEHDTTDNGNFEQRWHAIINFLYAMMELMTLPCGIVAVLFPLRTRLLFMSTCYYIELFSNNHVVNNFKNYNKVSRRLCSLWITRFAYGLLDFLCVIPGTLGLIPCPSLWPTFHKAVMHNLAKHPVYTPLTIEPDEYGNINYYQHRYRCFEHMEEYIIDCDEHTSDLGLICLVQFPFMLIDYISLPFGLLGLISPLRCSAFLATISPCFSASNHEPTSLITTRETGDVSLNMQPSTVTAPFAHTASIGGNDDRGKYAAAAENLQAASGGDQLAECGQGHGASEALPDGGSDYDLQMALQLSLEAAARRSVNCQQSQRQRRAYEPPSEPLFYDFYLREQSVYYGLTALVDVLLVPMLLPLIMTQYRLQPRWVRLFGAPQSAENAAEASDNADNADRRESALWGFEEYLLVGALFILLVLDAVIVVPLGSLLFLTHWRWRSVCTVLASKDPTVWADFDLSVDLYAELFCQTFVLLLDLLVLPFALFVAVCGPHRLGAILAHMGDSFSWNNSVVFARRGQIRFHRAVMCNAAVVLHDLVFMVPLCLFLVATVYRAANLWRMFVYFVWEAPVIEREAQVGEDLARLEFLSRQIVRERALVDDLARTADERVEGALCYAAQQREASRNADPPSRSPAIWPSSCVRSDIWLEFLSMLFDAPFFVLALLVLGTGWRAGILCKGIAKLHFAFSQYHDERVAYIHDNAARIGRYDTRYRRGTSSWYNEELAISRDGILRHEYYYFFNYRSIKSKYESSRRSCIVTQALLLFRDILCLVPFALIVGTVYRLPSLLLDMWLKVKASWAAKRQDPGSQTGESACPQPLYSVTAASMSYPEKGGPRVRLSLMLNPARAADSRIADGDHNGKLFCNIERDAAGFWAAVSKVLGSVLCSVARSMLPLDLEDGQAVNLEAIGAHFNAETRSSDSIEAWIQLDFGATKRTTTIKKLAKIIGENSGGDWRLLLQVDVPCHCRSDGDSDGDSRAVKPQPLFVFAPTLRQLLAMVTTANSGESQTLTVPAPVTLGNAGADSNANDTQAATTTFVLEAVNDGGPQVVRFATDALGGAAIRACAATHTLSTDPQTHTNLFCRPYSARKQDIADICEGGKGLVNSFWLLVCIEALELTKDLGFILMFVFVLCCPWRGIQLLVTLAEPVNRWSWRVATKCAGMLLHADKYMLDYRAGYSMFCNKHAKTILYRPSWGQTYTRNATISATRRQSALLAEQVQYDHLTYFMGAHSTGESVCDAFVRHLQSQFNPADDYYYNDRHGTDASNDEQRAGMKALGKLEREAMKPYQKIMQKVVAVLEKQDGCSVLLNAVTRRAVLHESLLRLWAFKTLINIEFTYASIETSNGTKDIRDSCSVVDPEVEMNRRLWRYRQQHPDRQRPPEYGAGGLHDVRSWKRELARDRRLHALSSLNSDTKAAILGMIWHQHRSICAAIGENKRQIATAVDALQRQWEEDDAAQLLRISTLKPGFKRTRKWVNANSGLFARTSQDTRNAIKQFFIQTLTDLGFICLVVFITLTIIRLVPLLVELHANNAFNIMRFTTKAIIAKHARAVANDYKRYLTFLGFTVLIFITGIGVPAFLAKIPRHMHSLDALNALAKHQFKKTLWYLCELLSLFTVWKTYKIIVTSILYSVLVPAACLGEVVAVVYAPNPGRDLYAKSDNAKCNFYVGIVLFYALFAGAVLVTVNVYNAADATLTASTAPATTVYNAATTAQLVTGLSVFGYLVLSTLIVSLHRKYWVSASTLAPSNVSSRTFTWSQLLALLTPLFEAAQLCAIVVYFFWDNTNIDIDGVVRMTSKPNTSLFISSMLQWDSSAPEYVGSMTAAVVCGLASALLISVPLAVGTSSFKAQTRWQAITTSPAFDTLNALLLRLFSVWVVATLLRPSGCAYSSGFVSYLSTATTVPCGGYTGGNTEPNEHWASIVALPLLCYIMVANTVLHADSVEFDKSARGGYNTASYPGNRVAAGNSSGDLQMTDFVKFAPLFTIVMRVFQYVVVLVCFIGFNAADTVVPLGLVGVASVLMIVWCVYWQVRGGSCSLVAVPPLRAAGVAAVLWCTIVCMLRNYNTITDSADVDQTSASSGAIASEGGLYIGWLVIATLGAVFSWREQLREHSRWEATLKSSGITQAMEALVNVSSTLMVEDAVSAATVSDSSGISSSSGGTSSTTETKKKMHISFIQKNFTNTDIVSSIPLLAHAALRLEDLLLVDRLSIDFLEKRQRWRQLLSVLYSSEGLAGLSRSDLGFLSSSGNNDSRQYNNENENENEVTIAVPVDSFDPDDPNIVRVRIEEGTGQKRSTSSSSSSAVLMEAGLGRMTTEDKCKITLHKNSLMFALYVLRTRIEALQTGITSAATSTEVSQLLVTRHVLEGLFSRRMPLEIVYEIYEYCFDIFPVKAAVTPILSSYDIKFSDVSLASTWSLGKGLTYTSTSPSYMNNDDDEISVQFRNYTYRHQNSSAGDGDIRSHMLHMFSDAVYNISRLKAHLAAVSLDVSKSKAQQLQGEKPFDTRVIDAAINRAKGGVEMQPNPNANANHNYPLRSSF